MKHAIGQLVGQLHAQEARREAPPANAQFAEDVFEIALGTLFEAVPQPTQVGDNVFEAALVVLFEAGFQPDADFIVEGADMLGRFLFEPALQAVVQA